MKTSSLVLFDVQLWLILPGDLGDDSGDLHSHFFKLCAISGPTARYNRDPSRTDNRLMDAIGEGVFDRVRGEDLITSHDSATGLEIRVAHYPPHCSKYNPIDHRLFPHVTRVCQGMFLKSAEMVRDLMRKATTSTGLRVFATIVDRVYDLGVEVADDFLNDMHVCFDQLLPDWNNVLLPS